jgi:phosphoribosylformylglycinamidine cyclo-ligase
MMSTDLYKEAGVDLDAANELVDRIRPLVKSTFHPGVITDVGGFGSLYSIGHLDYKQPVLVSSTDGIGTKLKVAILANRHDTVGIDLVAMSVNDILVQGARPLFFLDYLSIGRMNLDLVADIITGIAEGCRQAKCSLIGGETAEMPDFYGEGEYDLAGFAVGVVEKDSIIDGSDIHVGNEIIGLASSGLHSNGYSLVRRIIFQDLRLSANDVITPCDCTVAEELLRPTRIYTEAVQVVVREFQIAGMAHITGGGFYDNLPRILPSACQAKLRKGNWEVPSIFAFLQQQGEISDNEMYRVFNNGIGFVLILPTKHLEGALELLHGMGEKAFHIGKIHSREKKEPPVVIE